MSAVEVVVFRRWKAGGTPIALFPEIEATDEGLCLSFEHVGQHGAACYAGVVSRTVPADVSEPDVAVLKRELESAPYGYQLVVRQRRGGKSS